MKSNKKIFLLSFLISVSLLFTACSIFDNKEETKENISSSQEPQTQIDSETQSLEQSMLTGDEAFKELEEITSQLKNIQDVQYLDLEITATTLIEEALEVDVRVQSDLSNIDNPLMAITVDVPVVGNVDIYIKDGYSYAEVMGIKVRESLASNGVITFSNNTITNFDNLEDINDLVLTKDSKTGNKTFTFSYVSTSSINLDDLTNGLSSFNFEDGDILYTTLIASEDNIVLSMNMYSTLKENPEQKTANIDMKFNSFNQPFEIEFPDLSEYKSFN